MQPNTTVFRTLRILLLAAMALLITACGGGGGGGGSSAPTSQSIGGGGVKGPLANAVVTVYAFDSARQAFGYKSATAVTTATTDASAQITGLALPFPITPPYILEFTSDATATPPTIDLTTGQFPVIATMRTVITQALLDKGEQIYATPLTTMAVDIAVINALDTNGTAGIQGDEFENALVPAAAQVVSTVGFGMAGDIDIFDTPPLVDSTTDTTEEQADAAAYRTAVEALTAVVFQMDQQASGDTGTVLTELAADLADGDIDGMVDGTTSDVFTETTLQVMEQDPSTLPIPNSDDGTGNEILVGAVEQLLADETADTNLIAGTTITTTELQAGGTIAVAAKPAEFSDDTDGDGTLNADDAFPNDATETLDTDGDGVGDNTDTDADGDGWLNIAEDDYPLDATRFLDPALDRDSDTVANGTDPCPLDAADACVGIVDADGDLVADSVDNCPTVSNSSQVNTDGDVYDAADPNTGGDACDADIDGDSVLNAADAFPNDINETQDTDGDGVGDVADTDADGDGISDAVEDAAAADPDGDGIPNFQDIDSDGDGYLDRVDLDAYDAAVTINFAPVASTATDSTDEDVVLNGDVSASISDANTDTFTVAKVSDPSNGTVVVNANGTYAYTPSANFNGSDSFTFRATEVGTADLYNSNVGTVTITVNPVNDAPVGVADTGATIEDTALTDLALAANDTDVEGDTLTVTAVGATSANGGTVTLAAGLATYTPPANFVGNDTFTYTVSDGDLTDDTAIVTIAVSGVNDAPSSVADAITTDEDIAATAFDPAANDQDVDGDTLTVTAVDATSANGGTVTLSAGMVTYTPALNDNGTDTFGYTVSDGVLTDTGTVTVTVNSVGDAPVAVDDAVSVGVNAAATVIDVFANDINVDGGNLTFGTIGQPANGTVTVSLGVLSYTPLADYTGTETFTYVVNGDVGSDTGTVTVNVLANTPPTTGTIATLVIDEDSAGTTADVLAAASDNDGDTITLDSVDSSSAKGTIADNGNGTFTYTATANANGSDSFDYVITDGTSFVTGTVNVTITAVNDDPTATDDTASATANGSPVVINVLGNDAADIDADTVTVTAVSAVTGTAGGSVAVTNSGADVTYTPSASAGTATFSYTVSDGAGGSATANVTVTVADAADATGVWKTTSTVATLTPLITNGCDGSDPVSTVNSFYMTMTQAGTVMTAKTVWGDSLTGTIDNGTGAFTLAGTATFTDPFTGDMGTETISATGTVTSPTTWTGDVTITHAFQPFGSSSTDACTETDTLASTFVYKHVAGEDYNGVYGLELGDDWDRDSFAVQFEITGSTMAIHLPDMSPGETFTNTSFDPNTGFFSFDIVGVEDYEDGSGSEEWRDTLTGIFVRDPTEATLPTVAFVLDNYSAEYDAIGGEAGIGTRGPVYQDEENAYGKRLSSTGFTRGNYYRKNSDGENYEAIIMGMSHPPLKTANELYVEVLDGSTRLCTGLYSSRYTNAHYEPAVNMAAEEFQPQFYSFATCNTSTNTDNSGVSTHNVFDGMNYTVRIMDTGADGAVSLTVGGDDDTLVAGTSMTFAAEVNPDFFAEKPSVNNFALNGAAASKTMKQGSQSGLIEMFGFFDVNDDMGFSWTGVAGAEKYSLQMKEWTDDIEQIRFPLDTSAISGTSDGTEIETVTIPAGTLDQWDGNVIRIRARKDGTDANHRAMSTSKWAQIQPGIRGLFNVELGGALGQAHDTFQVWVDANMGDGTTGFVNDCNNINHNWTCNAGSSSVDYTTNTLSLSMTDDTGGLGTVVLDLTFTDSANGTVDSTSAGVTLTPSQTHVRLANPELTVRTLKPSGGAGQQSMAIVANTFGGATGFDKAVFKREDNTNIRINGGSGTGTDIGTDVKVQWCETGICGTDKLFLDVADSLQVRPTDDGVAQSVGHFLADRTNSDWGMGAGGATPAVLDATTYKSVWTMSSNLTQKWVFKKTYTAPDASVLVTPIHNQVTVNLTGGDVAATTSGGTGAGEAGAPINVISQPDFGLTWTGIVPLGGEWQIRVEYVIPGGLIPAGNDVRSEWMADGHADLTEGPVGTWTWTNGEGIALVSGDTVSVQIRARDGSAFTMLGAQRAGTTDDRIYLTIP